jgi:UDP-N-acetylmuramoyl-tripeptide--D-alanyl-D-alanine ligase
VIPLPLEEIAGIVGGRAEDASGSEVVVSGPAFLDTRTPEPGGLFVAFAGEHADGHDYARAAVEGGAAAVLGTRATGVPTVVVHDSQTALQELARVILERRREMRSPLTVVAVTGSQGKTTAKDMLAQVLGDSAPTVATAGSFNNELGLPLTVLRCEEPTRYLVLEMGARGVGHLAELCAIAPPDVSLVLNVGKAHIGEFGSREQIAVAKGELVEALRPDGSAVLNLDDPLVAAMARRTDAHVWTFGRSADAEVRLENVQVDDLGRPLFGLTYRGETEHVALRLLGEHQATNAAAVTAAALAAGRPLDRIATSLRAITHLSKWRMQLLERTDGLVVVNDAYNANPDSMRSALETLAAMGSGRRKVAVVGEMRELGAESAEEHRQVGLLADRLGLDVVVVVGSGAKGVYDALGEARSETQGETQGETEGGGTDVARSTTRHVETTTQAGEWLRENVAGPDIVLIKASRSERLERIAEMLIDDPEVHEAGEESVS